MAEADFSIHLDDAALEQQVREHYAIVWDQAIQAVMTKVDDDGMIDQHALIKLKNPYREAS